MTDPTTTVGARLQTGEKPFRLAVFESHPVQYHAPVYQAIATRCAEEGQGAIHVYYATDLSLRGHFDAGFKKHFAWDEPLTTGYPCTVLHGQTGPAIGGFRSLRGKRVIGALRLNRPDAVLINQFAYAFDWTAIMAARAMRIPIWVRTETQDQCFPRSRAKSIVRRVIYRALYSQCRRFFAIGRLNYEHFRAHGVSVEQLSFSRYCVVDRFAGLTGLQRAEQRQLIRTAAGFRPDQAVILFCGKLQPKKDPELLFDALESMAPAARRTFGLLFVGSGELEEVLRRRAAALPEVTIHFAGFKNQQALPPYYLAADIMVLPSRQMGETWGLVVNEALLAGCAVGVSRAVGCAADFGAWERCRVFDSGDAVACAVALRELAVFTRDFDWARPQMDSYSVKAAAGAIYDEMSRGKVPVSLARLG